MKTGFGRFKFPLFLFLLNLLLKGLSVDVNGLAHDEPFMVFYAQQSISEIFDMLHSENNPPLYFLLLHFLIKILGIGTFTLRFPALIFSALTAGVIYMIGERGSGRRVGVLAALLFTFSNYHLGFAHEVRVYALFGLLSALSMFFFLVMAQEPRKTGVFIGLCIVNILLPYTHFFGWFIIGIQLCALIFSSVREGILIKYAISFGIVLILYLPYLPILLDRATESVGKGTWLSASDYEGPYNMIWKWSNEPVVAVLFIFVLTIGAIWFILLRRKEAIRLRPFVLVILLWFLVPFIGMYLISFKVPIFLDRYLIFVSIAFYLLLAIAIERSWNRKWSGWLVSSLAVLAMVITFQLYPKDQERSRTVALEAKKWQQDGSLVLISPEWYAYNFSYHYDIEIFMDYRSFAERLAEKDVLMVRDAAQLPDLEDRSSVVYIDAWAELVDPEATVINALREQFNNEKVIDLESKMTLYLFSRNFDEEG